VDLHNGFRLVGWYRCFIKLAFGVGLPNTPPSLFIVFGISLAIMMVVVFYELVVKKTKMKASI
jgi:hypothetical protein